MRFLATYFPAGKWVDFGLTALSVGLYIPDANNEAGDKENGDGAGGGPGSQPELDVVQFPYCKQGEVRMAVRRKARAGVLKL